MESHGYDHSNKRCFGSFGCTTHMEFVVNSRSRPSIENGQLISPHHRRWSGWANSTV